MSMESYATLKQGISGALPGRKMDHQLDFVSRRTRKFERVAGLPKIDKTHMSLARRAAALCQRNPLRTLRVWASRGLSKNSPASKHFTSDVGFRIQIEITEQTLNH